MATYIGIPQKTWSNYETGKTQPPVKVLLKLEEKGYKIKWNMDGEEQGLSSLEMVAKQYGIDIEILKRKIAEVKNKGYDLKTPLAGLGKLTEEANSESIRHLPEPSSDAPNSAPVRNLPVSSPPGAVEDLSRFRKIASGYPTNITVYKFRKGSTEPMPINEPDPEGVVFIPIYGQRAAAGPGQEETQLAETESLMPIVFEVLGAHKPEHCGIVRVTGDSMTDITLNNGDWAIFDTHDLRGDGLFVISMFGEMRVKRLQYRLTDRKIIIASENQKRYPEPEVVSVETLDRGDLRIYGRVFSWIHRHLH